jgi:hypothetical protein
MYEAVAPIEPALRVKMVEVFCDSKASWSFAIKFKSGTLPGVYKGVSRQIAKSFEDQLGGHNDINLFWEDGTRIDFDIDPYWNIEF